MNADPSVPRTVDELDTPALLVESSIVERNLARMQALADHHGIKLRPHVKTHKCIELAQRQFQLGAIGVAVAKLGEAECMADGGISDIQVANQVVGQLKLERLRLLTDRIQVSCAVDSSAQVAALSSVSSAAAPIDVFVEVNTGLNRAGVSTEADVRQLARQISASKTLRLAGLLTHAGHAYAARSRTELEQIGRSEGESLVNIAKALRRDGLEIPVISVGSTPTASSVVEVAGITELRVGNYIFNDMTQVSLGVATREDCALTVLATVTSRPTSDRAVLDSGAKSLALDRGAHGTSSLVGYGELIGHGGILARLSEEHGIVESTNANLQIGDRVRIIPNHACPVVNLFSAMYVVDGHRIIKRLTVDARGLSQ